MHNFEVKSHSGEYSVVFNNNLISGGIIESLGTHYIIDKNVLGLLGENFIANIGRKEVVLIDANEETKSYTGIEPIITQLVERNLKRDSVLVAIGGGITQDIACFISTTFMRGIKWIFIPTTLLAQADSCIGSKSSINFGPYKNLLGSFTPPNQIYISDKFLTTLEDRDFKSGVGEIIKLFLINNKVIKPGEITRENISKYVYECLMIKKVFIEEDEFDKGRRQILNYGHCFGHGIESATNFAIPHGIAITMGMDVANKFALDEGNITQAFFDEMHAVLYDNYKEFANVPIAIDKVFAAMTKDKKNTGSKINLILPVGVNMTKRGLENTSAFWYQCRSALATTPITVRS